MKKILIMAVACACLVQQALCEKAPSFVWRGMMLDCSRHFFTVEEIKRNLDIMAELKLNLFHWHLTDGRGWRIEIDRYPELTKAGATAPSNLKRKSRWGRDVSDSGNGKYGPYFYTKAQIRDIVAHAKKRGIDVLPEVEIPGHSDAAIRAYPFLKCASGGRNELCLGRDEVLRFYENVLDEVCELFPFGFLHIGGDECNVSSWAKCADCQARKKTIGGKREQDLQHWVTRHFAEYLAKKGKRIVGWDEIAGDPLLRKDAVVMNWRGGTYAVDAARTGHDVVVCCHSPCYLDYPQQLENDPYEYIAFGGWLTAEAAYQYDPYRNFPPELRHRVLGGQGNVWTEITADQKELEWKTYTRLAVLAEVLNRHTELPRDWQAFRPTLEKRIAALKAKGVNMAPTGPLRKAEIVFPGGRKVKWGGGVCPILASKLTRNANGVEVKIDAALKAGEWKLSVDWRTARISVPDDASVKRVLAEIESVSFKYEPGVICIPIVDVRMEESQKGEGLVPFLAVTGKPTESTVCAKVEEIQKQGIGSFLVYARSGLEVEYMGEEWLRICDWFCSEAHRRGMKVWLYDEYNWPSGTCKGRVPQENDAWRYRELGVFPDGRGGFRWTEAFAPAGWVNVCEPAAVERFMELTHRVYEKRLAEWFRNGTIVGIFTDEPGHPTTVAFPEGRPLVSFRDYSGLEAEYKEETGRELRSDVERWLRQPQDDEVWPVYVSLLGRRFRSAYFDRIRDWCDRMGIVSTGHLISENDLTSSARQNGLPLLCLRGESLPGVDEIRTAYDPTNVRVPIEWTMYNLARQAILHRGNRGGLIELFACGPADLTPGVLRQVIWMSAFHGIDHYVSCMDVMDERGLVEKHGYLSPAGSVHPWYAANAGILADEARKAAQFARKTVSEGEVAVRYPQRQAALSAFAGGRVPRHLTDLLGTLELNQFTCRLIGEDESSDLPLVFGCSPDGRYFEERSGRKGLTAKEAVLMCGKLPRSFSVRETDGTMAGDLMMRTCSDGSSAVINLKTSSARTLWAERNGVKSRFFLQPHGVKVFAPGVLPPSEAERSTVRSLSDVEWELSVDRDNLLRVNFTSARRASVRFDGDVKNVKVVARDLAVSYAVTGSGRPIGLNEAAPKGEKVLRHEAEPYSFVIDGRPLGESGRCSELPSVFNPLYRTLEPRDLATGTHEFSIVTGESDRNYFLPALFLSGDFLVKDGGVSPRRTNKVRFGTLADYGYSNYVGKATWSAEVVAPDDPGVRLRLRTGGQTTSVRFCGVDLGVKAWEPYEWELPVSLRGRKGRLEISLWTSAQPMFGDEHAPGAEWDARFWQAVHMPGSNCGLQDGDWVVGKVISVGTGPREAL